MALQTEKEIIVVDSQRLNMIQMCAYKYDLTFNRQLVPLSKSEPIERGSLIHHMLETYYKMRKYKYRWSWSTPDNPKAACGQKEIIAICQRVGEHFGVKMDLNIEDIDDTFRVFSEYVEYYWSEPHETLAVEQVGAKILYEDEKLIILYETKIDWIYSLPQIPFMPTDHKSSSRRGPVHEISNQFIGYCWLLDVRNLMVNKIGFQTSVKPKDKFQRHIMSYSLPVIQGWVENSVWWIKMIHYHANTNNWPQNFTSCDKYSGCLFTPVCLSAPEIREFKMRQLFNISDKPWDVGAGLR